MTLPLEWEGIAIAVSHTSNWLNTGYDHFELRADQRLPVTQTGYRSHFMPPDELAQFDSSKTSYGNGWTTPQRHANGKSTSRTVANFHCSDPSSLQPTRPNSRTCRDSEDLR